MSEPFSPTSFMPSDFSPASPAPVDYQAYGDSVFFAVFLGSKQVGFIDVDVSWTGRAIVDEVMQQFPDVVFTDAVVNARRLLHEDHYCRRLSEWLPVDKMYDTGIPKMTLVDL